MRSASDSISLSISFKYQLTSSLFFSDDSSSTRNTRKQLLQWNALHRDSRARKPVHLWISDSHCSIFCMCSTSRLEIRRYSAKDIRRAGLAVAVFSCCSVSPVSMASTASPFWPSASPANKPFWSTRKKTRGMTLTCSCSLLWMESLNKYVFKKN